MSEERSQDSTEISTSRSVSSFGPYRVLERVGEGGMGEVFLADQTEPVRRRVAIKLIAGAADRHVVARFEAERQALALMDHAAIAKVFDAGQTPSGVPYFAMEYIAGTRITEYCDRNHLTTRERVALFIKVCDGVQHAHQKAILHRDLKPSNVLVTEQNGEPVPKIIDFGLAKAVGHRLTERTMHTQIGTFLGTLDYMSPEQAETSGQDVDTRTDVFSLGVMLYELLTGALPFDPQELRQLSYTEMIRRIREVEPPRPRLRLSTLGDSAPAVAKARSTEAHALARELTGDLEWIVMKAIEKDRARRYGSPADLAADLGRYLRDEPVLAGPPSTLYRTRKFVRRHRFGVAVAGAGLVLLVGFAVAMAVQAGRIARERDRANLEATRAQRVSGFLEDLFLAIDPARAKGKEVTVREVLDVGREKVRQELSNQPAVQVPMLRTLGVVYRNLGLYGPAHELLEQAVATAQDAYGPDARQTLQARGHVAWLLHLEGRHREAQPIQADILARSRRALGNEDALTRNLMNGLGLIDRIVGRLDEAEAVLAEGLELQRRIDGPEHLITLAMANNLAQVYRDQARYDEAEALCRETLEVQRRVLGTDHVETLHTVEALATVLSATGRYAEATSLHRKNYDARRRVLGDEHVDTLRSLRSVAAMSYNQGRYAEAEPLYRQVYEAHRRTRGEENVDTLSTLNGLALTIGFSGRHAEAEVLHRQVLAVRSRILGPDAPATIASLQAVAIEADAQGRHEEAVKLMTQVVEANTRMRGPDHPVTLESKLNLTAMLADLGRLEEANAMARDALDRSREKLGESHPVTQFAHYQLAAFAARSGRKAEAILSLRAAKASGSDLRDARQDQDFAALRGDPEFEALLRTP